MIHRRVDKIVNHRAGRRRFMGGAALFITIIALTAMTWAAIQAGALRVVIIGDSTAYTYSASDSLRGWGQELGFFFNPGAVTVINKAIGGRSSRSFIEDGHWASTKAILKKGDFLLISFGTNDRGTVAERHADTAQFRKFLTQYITESRAMGVVPILISTVNQNSWKGTTFTEGFNIGVNDYHGAMLRVVNELTVPFIDLEKKSAELFKQLGQAYLTDFFFIGGNTHFQEMGAVGIAKLVAEGIKELATDTEVGVLSTTMAPLYAMTVTANKTGAGRITESGEYPQNAPITLEVMPNSGQTFQGWEDTTGKSLSTQKIYKFTMGAAAMSFFATFKGGTTSVISTDLVPPAMSHEKIAVLHSGNGIVSVTSNDKIDWMRIMDMSGKCLRHYEPGSHRATLDITQYSHGTYIVLVRTAAGVTTHPVIR